MEPHLVVQKVQVVMYGGIPLKSKTTNKTTTFNTENNT